MLLAQQQTNVISLAKGIEMIQLPNHFAKISFVFNKHASDSKLSLGVGSSLATTSVFISAAGAAEEMLKKGVSCIQLGITKAAALHNE